MAARICYLLAGYGHTGGSMVLYKFMDKLSERGYEVYAVTPNDSTKWRPGYSGEVVKRFESGQPRQSVLERLPFVRRLRQVKLSPFGPVEDLHWQTSRLMKRWVPSEFTVATYCTTAYAGYMLMDKTLPLYHMQHYEELIFETELEAKIARLTYFLPLKLIANSAWLKDQVLSRTGRNSYFLNPGLETRVFYPRERTAQKYEKATRFTILSYYSPTKFKAWDDAVKAMKIVLGKARDRVDWVVFGGAPVSLPSLPVRFVGRVFEDHLADLYSSAQVCFMNSWYESFPFPPLEAMACGAAVVTTRFGTEDYAFDGENCLVVPPKSPETLAEAILRLVDDRSLAKRLAEAGPETARRFDWETAADNLERILAEARVDAKVVGNVSSPAGRTP